MEITITARHFKAHDTLRAYATDAISKLEQFYNGIISATMILSYEKAVNSVKTAELHIHVYGSVLKATKKSEEFEKSIDAVIEKAGRQLQKYKSKHREKAKEIIRKVRAKG
jgi:ribosomal subunit interface protein